MIKVFEPEITLSDYFSVFKALFSKNISGSSYVVEEFEVKLAKKFQRKYAVATTNGSSALDVAFKLLNLKKNDEVILPSFTIISCLSAIVRSGAKPVFCDVDKNSWNMTLNNLQSKFTTNTKAVLIVHTYGLAAEVSKIAKFCREKNIYLIEDAAEAHGQLVDGKFCGSFGDISTFSFYANKHITTGEGGAILTNNEIFYKNARKIINLDFNNNQRFKHEKLYWNYRIGGLQAALGISQISKIDTVIKNKITQGNYYSHLLKKFEALVATQPTIWNGIENHYWVYGVLLKKDNIRNQVIEELKKKDIETRPFFWPLHLQEALPNEFRKDKIKLEVSEDLGRNGLYLPMGNHVTKRMQNKIIKELIFTVEKFI